MKAFKPLPSNHQWSKKNFSLLFKFLRVPPDCSMWTARTDLDYC